MGGEGFSVVVGEAGVSGGGAGGGAGVYFTGDSLERKSRRLGSRSRRGSLSGGLGSDFPQNQPIVSRGLKRAVWLPRARRESSAKRICTRIYIISSRVTASGPDLLYVIRYDFASP